MDDITSAKAALRKESLARRELITPEESRAFGERLALIGARLAAERQARTASAFASIGAEPPTAPLLAALAKLGVGTALPVMQGRGKPLLFRLWAEGEPLNEVKWGIKEPLPEAPEVFPDLLFVPLAAYDRTGNRLGYGAGFYDRTLARLRAMKPITTVGVAFGIQETQLVPTDATDEKLDYVLTDRDWIICK
jgi:5-formyltetrahydrofolate cyclo-ligase